MAGTEFSFPLMDEWQVNWPGLPVLFSAFRVVNHEVEETQPVGWSLAVTVSSADPVEWMGIRDTETVQLALTKIVFNPVLSSP
jgi:hypothetical protein